MRLIDADALIEFIENRYEITWDSGTYEGGIKDACSDILEKIDNMENIKPETNSSESPNGWIPCEKKLPEKSEKYEVTIKNVTTIFDGETGEVVERVGYYVDCDIYKSYLLRKWHRYDGGQVIAWRKLPEPYQPKEDES